jgi:hypothetical protein
MIELPDRADPDGADRLFAVLVDGTAGATHDASAWNSPWPASGATGRNTVGAAVTVARPDR